MDTLIKIICFSMISVNFLNLSLLFIIDLMTLSGLQWVLWKGINDKRCLYFYISKNAAGVL